ncbi:hypothetical protein GWI33_016927 [Rhynchophorus ferrugineus]|uniref:Uncharacterized protein n=1 Tax=Rhynchophorus ferrugineus TaxID=354439 RepID=A0A834HXQ5_RHYFE|nr:hypothetical protein GWI33_016927 [Rhynchophorus ferrugineus]
MRDGKNSRFFDEGIACFRAIASDIWSPLPEKETGIGPFSSPIRKINNCFFLMEIFRIIVSENVYNMVKEIQNIVNANSDDMVEALKV